MHTDCCEAFLIVYIPAATKLVHQRRHGEAPNVPSFRASGSAKSARLCPLMTQADIAVDWITVVQQYFERIQRQSGVARYGSGVQRETSGHAPRSGHLVVEL